MRKVLQEFLPPSQSQQIVESKPNFDSNGNETGKSLYLSGICIQGDVRNANQRVYPQREIHRAVNHLREQIKSDYTILGECDHPQGLNINLDRVSHVITEMWTEGANGYGKLKILPTPMGQIIQTMIENGVKLGVSSRGSGNVKEDGSGEVSDFEIITVDVVAQPSAPGAYPTPIYEHLMNNTGGMQAYQLAETVRHDQRAQHYLKDSLINIINKLQ